MTEVETGKLLTIIAAAYSRFEVNAVVRKLWGELLADVPFDIAQEAVKQNILQSVYPPTIADIRKRLVEITTPQEDQIDSTAAWELVSKAVQQYGFSRKKEAYTNLPMRTVRAAQRLGWETICYSEYPNIIRQQFLQTYDQISQQETKQAMLPQGLQKMLQQSVKAIE